MLPDLLKTNLISIIQQLPKEDVIYVQECVRLLENQVSDLLDDNFELSKRIANTSNLIKKIKQSSDYINGIACDDMLNMLEGKDGKVS